MTFELSQKPLLTGRGPGFPGTSQRGDMTIGRNAAYLHHSTVVEDTKKMESEWDKKETACVWNICTDIQEVGTYVCCTQRWL